MNLFRRTRFPSPPPAAEDMPPRPQSPRQPMQWERPRGAMVTEGPREVADDPCGPPGNSEDGAT